MSTLEDLRIEAENRRNVLLSRALRATEGRIFEVRTVIERAISEGRVPTPTEINGVVSPHRKNQRMINAEESLLRIHLMRKAGYRKGPEELPQGDPSARWFAPGEEIPILDPERKKMYDDWYRGEPYRTIGDENKEYAK